MIRTIAPYKYYGQWVFDDSSTGLEKEAFISGIDVMLDEATSHIEDAEHGIVLLFSDTKFPGSTIFLDWVRASDGGAYYVWKEKQIEGWLCPALYHYFETAPEHLYIQVKPRA